MNDKTWVSNGLCIMPTCGQRKTLVTSDRRTGASDQDLYPLVLPWQADKGEVENER